ncbi:hypothetical protein [Mucilaginibacter ginsenosidivorans]|uniref:Lipoprotein n=1 Tax=Mucilaginibacter ginsenosidivorans TaxID=398053 RepID=A0A5B8UWU9_9SPHI|nr:hypothetical protein [Mucilaginibacter ginsenosidivorans]QEC63412.1 hypothetical protein FRZ54_12775 [Mucilaginibacter ginsenosidivorans]
MRILVLLLTLALTACSASNSPASIDKNQKAIVSANGAELKKVMVTGDGKSVTFQSTGDAAKNSIIYFNRVNPGFLVSEGFGLNQNYVLKLSPGKKYTVYIYTNPKDEKAYPIYFKTDYNGNIIDKPDDE